MAVNKNKKGYVKLYRKALDNNLIKDAYAWQLFTYCLLKAEAFGDGKGTFEIRQLDIQNELNISRPTIDKFLKILKRDGYVEYKMIKNQYQKSVIKIVNFSRYQ